MWHFQCFIWILDWKLWKISTWGMNWKPGITIVRKGKYYTEHWIWKYLRVNSDTQWHTSPTVFVWFQNFVCEAFLLYVNKMRGNLGIKFTEAAVCQSNKWVIVYPGTLQSSQPFLNPIQSILQLVGRDGGRYLMLHIPPWIAIEA